MEKIVYLLVLAIYTILCINRERILVTQESKDSLRKKYLVVASIGLIFLCSFRNLAVGADTYRYYKSFEMYLGVSLSAVFQEAILYFKGIEGKDAGFTVVMKLFQIVIPSFRAFMIFVYSIYFGGLISILHRHTTNIAQCFIALVLFLALFLDVCYIYVRPILAFGLLLFSIKFVEKREFIKFLILIITTSTIHISAIVFFPFYFLAQIRKIKFWMVAIAFFVPFLLVNINIIVLTIALTTESNRLMNYAEGAEGAGTPVFTALLLGLLIIYLIRLRSLKKSFSNYYFYGNILFISFALMPLTWYDPNFMRFLIYYTILLTIVVGKIVYSISNPQKRKLCAVGVVIFLSLLIIRASSVSSYAFMWEPAYYIDRLESKIIQESLF